MDQAMAWLGTVPTAPPAHHLYWPPARATAPARAAAPSAASTTPRVALIDISRGLFLFWMLTAHALSLAGARNTSPLALLIPPTGTWLSERFVVLTGFTIAWVFGARLLQPAASGWPLYRRALQIGSIAVLTNVLSRAVVDAAGGQLSWSSIAATLLMQREWSISWILLPTTVLLALSPWLLRAGRVVGPANLLIGATALGLVLQGVLHPVLTESSIWFVQQGFYLEPGRLITATSLGIWGLALALWARRFPMISFAAAFSVASVGLMVADSWVGLPAFAGAVSRFGVFFGVGLLATVLPMPAVFAGSLSLIGRNALLVFVSHRFYMQAEARLLNGAVTPETAGAVMSLVTLALILATCYVRESHRGLSSALKRVGL